jgi:hypothetical protein
MRWLTAAAPSLAGAAGMPYRAFAVRILVLRLPWLAGMLAVGALAASSLAAIGRIAGIAGLVASAAVTAVLLMARGRLPVWAIARGPGMRLAGLLLTAGLAAVACGELVQDTAAGEEMVHLNPQVADLVADHVPPDTAHGAMSLSALVQPPGLWFMAVMAVMLLHLKHRGRSTVRIAAAASGGLAIAGIVNLMGNGWDRHPPVSLGAAAVAALASATVLFAGHSMHPLGTGIVAAAAAVIAAGLMAALVIAGQPFTALAAGACLGTCVSAMVEAAARVPWGRWLADPPGPAAPGTDAAAR